VSPRTTIVFDVPVISTTTTNEQIRLPYCSLWEPFYTNFTLINSAITDNSQNSFVCVPCSKRSGCLAFRTFENVCERVFDGVVSMVPQPTPSSNKPRLCCSSPKIKDILTSGRKFSFSWVNVGACNVTQSKKKKLNQLCSALKGTETCSVDRRSSSHSKWTCAGPN